MKKSVRNEAMRRWQGLLDSEVRLPVRGPIREVINRRVGECNGTDLRLVAHSSADHCAFYDELADVLTASDFDTLDQMQMEDVHALIGRLAA